VLLASSESGYHYGGQKIKPMGFYQKK
jgi:hypothetical protein